MFATAPNHPTPLGQLAAVWGLTGVCALLGSALWRLGPIAVDALQQPLSTVQWVFVVGFVGFMAYAEGYKGFQKAFSPRVVVRADWLRTHATPLLTVLAPAVCMGLVHATRKRRIVSWSITTMVVGLIVGVRQLPSPWRGLVDAGVVVGLTWGLVAIGGWLVYAARGGTVPVPADVPEPTRPEAAT